MADTLICPIFFGLSGTRYAALSAIWLKFPGLIVTISFFESVISVFRSSGSTDQMATLHLSCGSSSDPQTFADASGICHRIYVHRYAKCLK